MKIGTNYTIHSETIILVSNAMMKESITSAEHKRKMPGGLIIVIIT